MTRGTSDSDAKGDGGWLKLLFLSGGTLLSFTVFGYAQEALTTTEYDGERFFFTSFLVLWQSVGNAALAALILCFTGSNTGLDGGVPTTDWLIVALGYLGAHKFGLISLKYIIFPLQVVVKSCKAIPVMFGEMIFANVRHSLSKKISVFLMCSGVVLFTLLGKKKGGSGGMSLDSDTVFGLGMVFLALVCDGLYGPYQNKIVDKYKPSAYHLMFNMNMWEAMFSLVICLTTGEIGNAYAFIKKHPSVCRELLQFGAAMGIGNMFIYNLQRDFGALVVTTTTTMRKLISVMFSVLWFGHSLAGSQWIAVGIVFLAPELSKRIASLVQPPPQKGK